MRAEVLERAARPQLHIENGARVGALERFERFAEPDANQLREPATADIVASVQDVPRPGVRRVEDLGGRQDREVVHPGRAAARVPGGPDRRDREADLHPELPLGAGGRRRRLSRVDPPALEGEDGPDVAVAFAEDGAFAGKPMLVRDRRDVLGKPRCECVGCLAHRAFHPCCHYLGRGCHKAGSMEIVPHSVDTTPCQPRLSPSLPSRPMTNDAAGGSPLHDDLIEMLEVTRRGGARDLRAGGAVGARNAPELDRGVVRQGRPRPSRGLARRRGGSSPHRYA